MRPERLVLEGFAPFRDQVTVDFDGLELFALTGPTGAGKSSVIDAMVFALYGSVPRHGKRSVEPVISLGRAQTRVQFEFEVEGRRYQVVRKVQRNPRGGVGSEARLEHGDEVLASGSEVTPAIETLLGLGLEHFTRSVVLPQGEFAAFLHDTPSGQQDLVKALLDMGVLDTVRQSATERAKAAAAAAEQIEARLTQLEDATDEAVQSRAARVVQLEKLDGPVKAAESAIAEGEVLVRDRRREVELLQQQKQLLEGVEIPEGVAELAVRLEELRTELSRTMELLDRAEETLEALEKQSRQIPLLNELQAARDFQLRLEEAKTRLADLDLKTLETAEREATAEIEASKARLKDTTEHLARTRDSHAAHALVSGLSTGDPCPVCQRSLEDVPEVVPSDLDEATRAVEIAEKETARAEAAHRQAVERLSAARASREALEETIGDLEARLSSLPRGSDLEAQTEKRMALDDALTRARADVTGTREATAEIRQALDALAGSRDRAWRDFEIVRDRLAGLEPPPAAREDLGRAWRELAEWGRLRLRQVEEEAVEAVAAAEEAASAVDKQRDEVARLLEEAGVEGSGSPSSRLAGALASARAELERMEERREERQSLQAHHERLTGDAVVANALSNHLRANRFEAWLLEEALATLVEGANHLLDELTSGAYSLTLNGRSIEVVDHRNADECRSVRSLSGGETFLVSLALALSLGQQLADLSDRGGARLEAIFLDEGFGSLDAETLETVTAVVSELASQGRMVGVVTHVKELAEQMPARFEVRPGPSGSVIESVRQ